MWDELRKIIKNFLLFNYYFFKSKYYIIYTEGTSGINACGVGSSDEYDANYVCETTDIETRKIQGQFPWSSSLKGWVVHLLI